MFKFSETATYAMPAHFGGHERPPAALPYPDVTFLVISYETDAGMLDQYIPEGFELTQSVVSIQYAMSRGVEWLGGSAYNLIEVNAPVAYSSDPDRLEGRYALVVWENKTAPILGGRDFGIPKVFADIEDLRQLGDTVFTNAGYEGLSFLRMDLRRTRQFPPEELTVLNEQWGLNNSIGWRYIPNIGRAGAALSHATLYPRRVAFAAAWAGEGRLHWEAPIPERHPTQARIIHALNQLPIKAYHDCMLGQGSMVLRNDLARPLP